MVSLPIFPLFIVISLSISLQISPATSLHCESQKFPNKTFSNCSDLPQLNSSIHWNFNSSNSSLSVAFVASPAKPNGWVSWAINPTKTGMVGSQAFIAFPINNSLTVKSYNIMSYHNLIQSKLSFDFWDLSAEQSNGVFTIFAAVKVPEKTEKLNQVWQVGSAVSDAGVPEKHAFDPANLNAKGVLEFGGASAVAAPPEKSPGGKNGVSVICKSNVGFILSLLFVGVSLIF